MINPVTTMQTVNHRMHGWSIPHAINEPILAECLDSIETIGDPNTSAYWLLLSRLFEAALICAGHYANLAEFKAAGDLLVNPRRVTVYGKNNDRPESKHRHCRISDQFIPDADCVADPRSWLRDNVIVRVACPALLPDLHSRLGRSNRLPAAYLSYGRDRMNRIADTLGFWHSWGVTGAQAVHARLASAAAADRALAKTHYCAFSRRLFDDLGRAIAAVNDAIPTATPAETLQRCRTARVTGMNRR